MQSSSPVRLFIALILLLSLSGSLGAASPAPAAWQARVSAWQTKVDAGLLAAAAQGDTEFLVFLKDQADLSGAAQIRTRLEKGRYVFDRLNAAARRSQGPVIATLAGLGATYRPYWVANMIWVRGDLRVLQALAQRSDVAHLYENPAIHLDLPPQPAQSLAPTAPQAIEWNIAKVNAPQVWAAGFTGQGVVIGGQDTGYLWQHVALKGKYRGWNGSTVDHNYNWHDAIHSGGGNCGANSPQPCDDYGHGTHTMGTMVGDDGQGDQIGMAPGAKWIGCRNMNQGTGSPATYTECFQWFLAPTDLNDQNPEPSKAPDIINNSWGCPPQEGCSWDSLQAVIANVRAAGILVVVSAGNYGNSCGLVTDPPAIYAGSFTVGATDPIDTIASFSSRGPAQNTGLLKPDVTAPGVSIRSSTIYSPDSFGQMQGTSMAAPHVTGLAALLISAQPSLDGHPDRLESLITHSSLPLTTTQACGGVPGSSIPNNTYGWGRIDALNALNSQVLLLHKTVSAAEVNPGDTLTYRLAVQHTAALTPTHTVVISDVLPAHTSFITATLPYTRTGDTFFWQFPGLAPDASREVSLTVGVPVTVTGLIVNDRYGVHSAETAPLVGIQVRTSVVALKVSKISDPSVFAGQPLTYTLSVTNTAALGAAHNVLLTDTLPGGTALITATLPFTQTGNVIHWEFPSLAPRAGLQVHLVVQVPISASGPIVNLHYVASSQEAPEPVYGAPVETQVNLRKLFFPWVRITH